MCMHKGGGATLSYSQQLREAVRRSALKVVLTGSANTKPERQALDSAWKVNRHKSTMACRFRKCSTLFSWRRQAPRPCAFVYREIKSCGPWTTARGVALAPWGTGGPLLERQWATVGGRLDVLAHVASAFLSPHTTLRVHLESTAAALIRRHHLQQVFAVTKVSDPVCSRGRVVGNVPGNRCLALTEQWCCTAPVEPVSTNSRQHR